MVRRTGCASSAEPLSKLGAGSFKPTNLGDGAALRAKYFVDSESPPGQPYSVVLIRLRPGADVAANRGSSHALLKQFAFCGGDPGCVKSADPPGDISNYGRIRGTTFVLAASVLAIMAIGALGHGLITSVRRRRRDLALLKTIGFTRGARSPPRPCGRRTATAAIALVIGLPIGIGLGRIIFGERSPTRSASTLAVHAGGRASRCGTGDHPAGQRHRRGSGTDRGPHASGSRPGSE